METKNCDGEQTTGRHSDERILSAANYREYERSKYRDAQNELSGEEEGRENVVSTSLYGNIFENISSGTLQIRVLIENSKHFIGKPAVYINIVLTTGE